MKNTSPKCPKFMSVEAGRNLPEPIRVPHLFSIWLSKGRQKHRITRGVVAMVPCPDPQHPLMGRGPCDVSSKSSDKRYIAHGNEGIRQVQCIVAIIWTLARGGTASWELREKKRQEAIVMLAV